MLSPESFDNYYNRGNTYFEMDQYLQAIDDYSEALRLKPDYALAYVGQGKSHLFLEQNIKAIDDFSNAIRIDPEIGIAFNMRGLAHKNLGDFRLAIDDYNQAIKLNPEHVSALFNLGHAYFSLEQYDDAVMSFEEVLRIDPGDAAAYANRALANAGLGKDSEARRDLDEAVALGVDRPTLEAEIERLILANRTTVKSDDHGDSQGKATPMKVGSKIDGSIQNVSDLDVFSFQTSARRLYVIIVTLDTLDDSFLELRFQDVDVDDDNSGEGLASLIGIVPSEDDTSYATVSGVNGATGSYVLTVAEAGRPSGG